MKVKNVVACFGLVAALLLSAPTWAAPSAGEETSHSSSTVPGQEPVVPSIYGEQGPPAVPVRGAGGANVGATNDTAIGRGGTLIPIPPEAGLDNSSDINEGKTGAGTIEAAGGESPDRPSRGRSFPIFPAIIGLIVVAVVASFLIRMRRPNDER